MSDPLSVSATVVHLIGSCVSTAKTLNDLRFHYKHANLTIGSLCTQIAVISASLSQLQSMVLYQPGMLESRFDARPDLKDTFDTALTGCIVVLSALDLELAKLSPVREGSTEYSKWAKTKYMWNEDTMALLSTHLEKQEGAISLLLQTLQIQSSSAMQSLLKKNTELLRRIVGDTARLRRLHPEIDAPSSIYTPSLKANSIRTIETRSSAHADEFEFDDVLVNTGVYRRTLQKWSNTISKSTNPIVPETTVESAVSVVETITLEETAQLPVQPAPDSKSTDLLDEDGASDVTIDLKHAPVLPELNFYDTALDETWQFAATDMEDVFPRDSYVKMSTATGYANRKLSEAAGSGIAASTDMVVMEKRSNALSEETTTAVNEASMMRLDDNIYVCPGCGEIPEEGEANEITGNRWHVDCFGCNTCGLLLDPDCGVFLLGDGSLICNNCIYPCSKCGNRSGDLIMLSWDEVLCASCFECQICKRTIEDLRYVDTSHGIICVPCNEFYESLETRLKNHGLKKQQEEQQGSDQQDDSVEQMAKLTAKFLFSRNLQRRSPWKPPPSAILTRKYLAVTGTHSPPTGRVRSNSDTWLRRQDYQEHEDAHGIKLDCSEKASTVWERSPLSNLIKNLQFVKEDIA